MALTRKQEAFAGFLAAGKTQIDAYERAFNPVTQNEKDIASRASKLAKKPEIKARALEIRNEKLKSKITLKEEAFIQELIKGKSQREAYKTAFSCKNWKPESIDARASHLFNTDKVQVRYKEAYAEVVAAVRKDTILNQEQVMQELSCIARQQITDYLSWDDKHINVKPSDLVDSRAIKSVTYDKNGKLVLEFYDKQKALEKLLDIYDKADQTNDNDITVNIGAAAEYAE